MPRWPAQHPGGPQHGQGQTARAGTCLCASPWLAGDAGRPAAQARGPARVPRLSLAGRSLGSETRTRLGPPPAVACLTLRQTWGQAHLPRPCLLRPHSRAPLRGAAGRRAPADASCERTKGGGLVCKSGDASSRRCPSARPLAIGLPEAGTDCPSALVDFDRISVARPLRKPPSRALA